MNKVVTSGNDAMKKIKDGVDLVANPVKSTLGLLGRTVIMSKGEVGNYQINDYPLEVTKDGYK